MRSWDYLEGLSRLPARGSATEGERRAARWLGEQLQALGYEVEMQPFRSPRHTLYIGPALVIAVVLGALGLSLSVPAVAAVLAVAALVPLVGEMLGAGVNFDLILPKRASQNVLARPPGARRPGGDVVVVAHYDTQWGSWLFAPAFQRWLQPFFVLTYGGLALALAAIVLRWALGGAGWIDALSLLAGGLLVATGAFLLGSWLTGRAVPGANDNGSGVAVALAAAARWMEENDEPAAGAARLNPTFLFTGCEEVGLRGMHRFLDGAEMDPGTVFVNIDNVGGGRLRFLLGEGMLAYQPYDADLLATARTLAEGYGGQIAPLKNLLLPTDGLLPAKAGFPAITFLAMNDDGTIPHYHWHTDTLENVDRATVELTERFVWDFLSAVGGRA